jgi:HAD superfamily hydrolase (TIGR01458 family)
MASILLDIDGVLHVSGEPIPGAAAAVCELRKAGHQLRFVTNNTTRARATLAEELRAIGFELEAEEIHTTPLAAAALLPGAKVLPLTMRAIHGDLEGGGTTLVDEEADAVLVGGADETEETAQVFAWENLNRAFAELQRGARLVCLHRNRWWQTARGPLLDAGLVVAGLEFAAGTEAEVVGKPSRAYFQAALDALRADAGETTMVGDDVEADIGGAKAAGLRAVLVRTGKFREDALAVAREKPDGVVDSLADVPGWLAERARAVPA